MREYRQIDRLHQAQVFVADIAGTQCLSLSRRRLAFNLSFTPSAVISGIDATSAAVLRMCSFTALKSYEYWSYCRRSAWPRESGVVRDAGSSSFILHFRVLTERRPVKRSIIWAVYSSVGVSPAATNPLSIQSATLNSSYLCSHLL